jgi:uncharacterized membrane protein YjjP (DUF1212 family)
MTDSAETVDPVVKRHRDLEQIAHVALKIGATLLQTGASVRVVHEGARKITTGLGAEVIGMRAGYGSFEITVGSGGNSITRMIQVGRHGVNHRLDFAVRDLAVKAEAGTMGPEEIDAELGRLKATTPSHPPVVVALATGTACAAFARLLGVDWAGFLPVLVAGSIGQYMRHTLLHRGVNVYVMAAIVAFSSAVLGGIGARLAGSASMNLAMMASILLLVPGVPSTNAQTDIMDGYPTMGSARAVSVAMIMVFAATGVWLAEMALGVRS